MKLAFISDIHANIHALRAVWTDLQHRQVDQIICLGDLVGYGANPNDSIRFVQRNIKRCTLGSSDARVAYAFTDQLQKREGLAEETLNWTRTVLEPEFIDFLRKLPSSGRLETPQGRLRYCHGSPNNPDERIDLQSPAEELEDLLSSLHCEILVTAGTHVPFMRKLSRGLVVDPGSVGLSLNGEPGADVTILDISSGGVRVQMIKVPYDLNASALDVLAVQLPKAVAKVIKTGKLGG